MNPHRVGILGGTFDPPHAGHLFLAQDAREHLALDLVLLVPAAASPLKGREAVAPAAARLELARAAAAEFPWLEVEDFEVRRGGLSFSFDTATHLRRRFGPEAELFWLVGADQAAQLHRWHRAEELAKLVRFAVAGRRAASLQGEWGMGNGEWGSSGGCAAVDGGITAGGDAVGAAGGGAGSGSVSPVVVWLPERRVDISSTEVRERARRGLSLELFLPAGVRKIIQQRNLYS
ncbi:MAG: nicotinate-nucleotide adenylyltransferase [Puniceicoccales bacterium]|jgi:nicotinate-nucleotide adenylyltransferase|nr:nicotinate-nucleotide adenylyltransferase [Puniceicoccales bacterium]